MEKVIALVWGPGDGESGDALRHQLMEDTLPRLHRSGARAATFNVHDSAADQAPSPGPAPEGESPHVAEVSMWLDCYERTAGVDEALAALRAADRLLPGGRVPLRRLRHHPLRRAP